MKRLLSISLFASAALMAAPLPINTGDILRQVEPAKLPVIDKKIPTITPIDSNTSNKNEVKKLSAPKESAEIIKIDKQEILPQQAETINIKKFLFRGNSSIKSGALQSVVAGYNNRELTTKQILEAADEITAYYKSKGFVNARAYIYKSDIHKDTITITIAAKNHNTIMSSPDILRVEDLSKSTKDDVLQIQQEIKPDAKTTERVELNFYVKEFIFSGNTVFDADTLSNLIKSYENKELGINELKEAASVITKYYRDKGYFVARAYIPAQSLESGVVKIIIIEGIYGAFDIKNSSLVEDAEIQGFMDELKGGDGISTKSLERQMLLINDLSGAQVTNAEVYPGQEVGESDFRITVSPTPKYSGYAIVDNYGSRYTGENRLSAGAFINSISGIGDTLSFSTLLSHTGNLKNGRLAYERPLGYSGLKGGVSFSMTDYELDKILNYDATGRTDIYNAYLSYPFIKTRAHTLSGELSYDHKEMKDLSEYKSAGSSIETDSRKRVDSLTLKLNDKSSTTLLNLPGTLFASVGVSVGDIDMASDDAKASDTSLKSEGTYTKVTMSANHIQALNPLLNLQTNFKAQKSFSKNLDSSEDISVGGSNGVRAYEDAELSGDKGYALSLDLIYQLPKIAQVNHNTSLFIDHAKVWKNTDIFNTDDNSRTLNALGIGYALNYGLFDLRATFAHGFGSDSTPESEAEFTTSKNKFLIQGMMRF